LELWEIKKAILHCLPDWTIDSLGYLGEGDSCFAYLVNGEWIFRFAKHDAARESLRREFCLLPKLAAHIALSIPLPEIACFDDEKNSFIAYRLLSGGELSQAVYLNLGEESRTHCAEQAAHFLNQLHRTNLETAASCGVLKTDYKSQYSELLKQAREFPFTDFNETEGRFVERVIEDYLESAQFSNFQPTLLHGDLSPDHLIFDDKTNRISAVIDFGDMSVGDGAWDFLWIYEDYGLDFLSRMLPVYSESDKPALLRRVHQFSLLQAVEWAADCRKKDEDDSARALTELRNKISRSDERLLKLLAICRTD
jgi:aminoglycoside 2''-phosphotransferase